MAILLSSTYFGPVQWYQKLNRSDCFIERYDSFIKQTYRNRCVIPTTNGPLALTVPVERQRYMKDIRISDHGEWRHQHWNALLSAYGESPFFEYYEDDIRPFFEKRWEYLYDFNWEIMEKMCSLLDVRPNVKSTEAYQHEAEHDFRDIIRPKHPGVDSDFVPRAYYQVYQQKFGFMPNMSILDLLFNMGNEAIFYL